VLQKTSTGDDPLYFVVCQAAHHSNADAVERMVSRSFYSYVIFVTFILNSIFYRINI
jgi:hypothetical protein